MEEIVWKRIRESQRLLAAALLLLSLLISVCGASYCMIR